MKVSYFLRHKLSASKLCSLRYRANLPQTVMCPHIKGIDAFRCTIDINRNIIVFGTLYYHSVKLRLLDHQIGVMLMPALKLYAVLLLRRIAIPPAYWVLSNKQIGIDKRL